VNRSEPFVASKNSNVGESPEFQKWLWWSGSELLKFFMRLIVLGLILAAVNILVFFLLTDTSKSKSLEVARGLLRSVFTDYERRVRHVIYKTRGTMNGTPLVTQIYPEGVLRSFFLGTSFEKGLPMIMVIVQLVDKLFGLCGVVLQTLVATDPSKLISF